ncbi:catalytic domain [Penicillium brevicompactum]|uniref:uncharacterized protein n=1 Tax=Penicillium brevicompactum TaxID=5074 RepID=UPI0025426A58|nr:uncharacterized protein N7506_005038 [Penicillium brevicompactum]KAJ5337016.1 hypothetical protein N7506_005038 [Penicillium brevicompactum]
MPRQDFLRDLDQAAAADRFPCLSNIRAGEYDGSISFDFIDPVTEVHIDLQAIVSDSHDYLKNHTYLVFATSENCPPTVNKLLENSVALLVGFTVDEMLSTLARIITDSMTNSDSAPIVSGDESESDFNERESVSSTETNNQEWESDEEEDLSIFAQSDAQLRAYIRRDLGLAKRAGFRVGYLGSETGNFIVTMSCRISKLAISDEAMHTWNVKPSEYVVLLIRYTPNYMDLQRMVQLDRDTRKTFVQMHVGLCNSYKPSLQQAMSVFQGIQNSQTEEEHIFPDNAMGTLRPLFIGTSLNSLLEERFLGILKIRLEHCLSWTGAELLFHTNQGKTHGGSDLNLEPYQQPDNWAASRPKFLAADHVADMDRKIDEISFPLSAMQFTLRHFVKCTEFCLVCHCKTNDTFEAIKPYVCSSGLCLYQYMALAMGPSLEYEIRSQPLVVELLISLACYGAISGDIGDLPEGLRLRVPAKLSQPAPENAKLCDGDFNPAKLDMRTDVHNILRAGDWIVILADTSIHGNAEMKQWHCRVEHVSETSGHMDLSRPICEGRQLGQEGLPSDYIKVKFAIYDTDLDDLEPIQKRSMMLALLGTIPDVQTMHSYINKNNGNNNSLSNWKQVLSPAALNLLRWVVASNRSYISQDNQDPSYQVTGMNGWVQFRLVQGAADKEQRFTDAVNSVSLAKNPNHPTLFAWHGSPTSNWHSILREGLHFKRVVHGRASGHGVYMSRQFDVSIGYVSRHGYLSLPPNRLVIASVMSLNEVVNSPEDFVSSHPHYVVQHLDWVQPRYLFVKAASPKLAVMDWLGSPRTKSPSKGLMYKQDQTRLACGPHGGPIEIPILVLTGKRGQDLRASANATSNSWMGKLLSSPKRRKLSIEGEGLSDNDEDMSVKTDEEDINILLSDDELPQTETPLPTKPIDNADLKTDFLPGTLLESTLPRLSPPQYATTIATKALQQHLNTVLKVQKQVPLQDLGWYVDHSLINTVYQWIVELHSFDPEIPLAKDLKAAKMQSIVLELRFPAQFPMEPPFVRVIRPRFLEFSLGGGGHVTGGGAMCMELLTQSGWLPTSSIESVLLQVRMAILNPEPRPARLSQRTSRQEYSVGEAVEAYKRVALAHGWKISSDYAQIAW